MYIYVLQLIFLFILFVYGPDFFIPKIIKKLRSYVDKDYQGLFSDTFPRVVGWIERSLYGIFLIFIPEQFTFFIGIWLAFKVIGSFNTWEPSYREEDYKPDFLVVDPTLKITKNDRISWEYTRRRSVYMIFTIGTGISLLWVIVLGLAFKFLVNL